MLISFVRPVVVLVLCATLMGAWVALAQDDPTAVRQRVTQAAMAVQNATTLTISVDGLETTDFLIETATYSGLYTDVTVYTLQIHVLYDPATNERRSAATGTVTQTVARDGVSTSTDLAVELRAVGGVLYVRTVPVAYGEPSGLQNAPWTVLVADLSAVEDFGPLGEQLFGNNSPLSAIDFTYFDPDLVTFSDVSDALLLVDDFQLGSETLNGAVVDTIRFMIDGNMLVAVGETADAEALGPFLQPFYDNLRNDYRVAIDDQTRIAALYISGESTFSTTNLSGFDFPAGTTGTLTVAFSAVESTVIQYGPPLDLIQAPRVGD